MQFINCFFRKCNKKIRLPFENDKYGNLTVNQKTVQKIKGRHKMRYKISITFC